MCIRDRRELSYAGRPLVDGFGLEEHSWGGRVQVLVPWPNRLTAGRFSFGGHDLVLPLTEPELSNASHGLVRWAAWTLEEHTAHSVSLTYRLMARTGWPWTLDLHVVHDLSADGLTVTVTATNMSPEEAPYAAGSHPYLCVGSGPVDQLELTLPAATALRTDDHKRAVGSEPVDGGELDFRVSRPLRSTVLDTAFTDLERDEWGRATTTLRDPRSGEGVSLWVDPAWTHLQVFTADGAPAFTQFSASNGGWTRAGAFDYLAATEDPWDAAPGNPYSQWNHTVTAAALEKAWPGSGSFVSLAVTARDGNGAWGGRVVRVEVRFTGATRSLTGDQFRSWFGLRSDWFRLQS